MELWFELTAKLQMSQAIGQHHAIQWLIKISTKPRQPIGSAKKACYNPYTTV